MIVRRLIAVLGAGSLLAAAGCGGSAPSGAAGDAAGSGDGPVRIGALHPVSGSMAVDGLQMRRGAQLAVEQINESGGIASLGGREVRLATADTQGKPEIGQSEAQRLISDGAVGLIGTYQSSVSSNVSVVAERNEVPFVMDVTASDEIFQHGYRYSFRVQPGSAKISESAAEYLEQVSRQAGKPAERVAVLHEQTDFGTGAADAFEAAAGKLGMEVGPRISYDATTAADFTSQITQVKASGADVLVVAGYYGDSLLIAQAVDAVEPDLDAVWGVSNGAYDQPKFVSDAGELGDRYFSTNYHFDAQNPETRRLRAEYRQRFGAPMRTGAVLSYDAVQAIAAGVEEAGSTDPAAVRDGIARARIDPLTVGNGPVRFGRDGENVNSAAVLMQIQNGRVKQVYPPEKAESDPDYSVAW